MKKNWTILMMALLLVSAPALAEYPDDCLGEGEASGSDCGDVTYEGCCDDLGNVLWCDGEELYCLGCAAQDAFCGWMVDVSDWYGCMETETGADPSGENPIDCVGCDPACAEGEICVDGACEVCTPDCAGALCGSDGCGGSCGECAGECVAGLCHAGPGCEVADIPTCDGCSCEECVCAADDFCCNTAWDSLCVDRCIAECGGCPIIESCGNETCEDIENCGNCPADCGCAEGDVCSAGECCTPWCGGKNCGDDGCGGDCGECVDSICMDGVCAGHQGCGPLDGPTCGGCECEECVCEMDPYCCDTAWDTACVSECTIDCGSCIAPEAECGNGFCELGEDCGACADDCTCAPGWICEEAVCVESGECVPACDAKDCGDDGCEGSCGECEEGFACDPDGLCAEEICEPDCTDKNCGSDGCEGSCGDCAEGELCSEDGLCGEPVLSCEGLCGDGTDTCYCDDVCFANGDCCDDVCDFCGDLEGCNVCEPDCEAEGKECGDDGCEGTCGVCEAGECTDGACVVTAECGNGTVEGDEVCEADGDCGDTEICIDCACVAGCTPSCEGKECGDDGCEGLCGECGEDLVCGEAGLCEAEAVEGDVVTEGDAAGDVASEEPSSGGSSSSCSTTGGSDSSALLLVLMALLAMAGIRRQEA